MLPADAAGFPLQLPHEHIARNGYGRIMGANSSIRRLVKKALYPVIDEREYRYMQAMAMAWDIRLGRWSEPELDLIPYAARPGDTVLDLGANYGMYSYHLSRAVRPTGRVFAFEPVPFTAATLSLVSRLLRFRNVELIAKGCSDSTGIVTFKVPVQDLGMFSAGLAYIGQRNDDRVGKETQVRWRGTCDVSCEIIAIDEFLPELNNLSFIKCDVEGSELFAFRGAVQTIDRNRPTVLCEINPWYLEGFGVTISELTRFFFDRRYQLYHYGQVRGRNRLYPLAVADIVEDNYVFVHPDRIQVFAPLLA